MKWKYIAVCLFISLVSIAGWWYQRESEKQDRLIGIMKHQAQTAWLPDINPSGRPMEEASRQKITLDYLNAWKQQSICLFSTDSAGLYSYFVPEIRTIIRQNARDLAGCSLVQKDLKHTLQLRFYALDGQLASLSDSTSIELSTGTFTQVQKKYYHALLLLEEGHWRIKNLRLN